MALQNASEAAFRTEAPDYESIIVSTHGCFRGRTPMATDIKPTATDDCLSQNIIAFAGVNPNLGNSSLDPYTMADGLLSAREIRDLDLRKPMFRLLAAFGHMGREDLGVAWEKTDRTEALKKAVQG